MPSYDLSMFILGISKLKNTYMYNIKTSKFYAV